MYKRLLLASAMAVVAPLGMAAPAMAEESGTNAAGQGTAITDPQEQARVLQEMQELRARLTALEKRLGVPAAPANQAQPVSVASAQQASAQQASTPSVQHAVLTTGQPETATPVQYSTDAPARQRDHNLELYGFVQLDAIQDFKRVNPDWDATLRPSRIPTVDGQFGGDGQSIFSVRQSRLGVKASGMLANKPYEAKFEFDLYGVGDDAGQTTMRVRHMYASWGPFLAGQTNTLFMDGDIFPNTIDYWGPAGMVFVRNPQLRWTFVNNDQWTAAIALEHPSDDIDPGRIRLIDEDIANNLQSDEELPDLTAAVRYGGDWGHIRLAGLLRKIGYETRGTPGNEPDGSQLGWGIDGTSVIKLSPATLRLGVVYGEGIATYMNDGGMDLAPSATVIFGPDPDAPTLIDLDAKSVPLLGVSAYVDLQWSKKWSSSLGYSLTHVDNTNFQEPTAFHQGEYASGNLLWTPADNVLTGAELLWGQRTDNDGAKGDDWRLQYSFKWSFSSKNIWDIID